MKNLIQHSSYQRQSFYGAFNRISKVSGATDEPGKSNTYFFGMVLGMVSIQGQLLAFGHLTLCATLFISEK